MQQFTIQQLGSVMQSKGYAVFDDDTHNYDLNIVGVRHNNCVPNSFDDSLYVFWKNKGNWQLRMFPCTTDPGLYWLLHLDNPAGTAIVKEGQYRHVWSIGLHKGYTALVQASPVTVIRDFDKDATLRVNITDLSQYTKTVTASQCITTEWKDAAGKLMWREQTGLFGIDCHRAAANGSSITVDNWSAGCQVLQNRYIFNPDNQQVKVFEFDYFMHLCSLQTTNGNGNAFTYTLLNERDIVAAQ